MAITITSEEFSGLFGSFERSAFRLESLDTYTVPDEAVEFRRFLDGEALPTSSEDEWARFIKKSASQNKVIQRVHVIGMPLTPYLKYEIEWGYLYSSVAGEDIYLIDRAHAPREIGQMTDFWLFDRKILVLMRYDSDGRFLHGDREDSPEIVANHCDLSEALLRQATPLKTFLTKTRNA
jgi:hypothetical protein